MTKQTLNPYLNFRDTARPAMEFYKSIFGGELTMNTFAEYGQAGPHPGSENLIMHSQLETPAGFTLMGSDTPPEMEQFKEGGNVSISLSGDDETALTGYWNKLADGAAVTMPLNKAPWGDSFGMLTDKFGIAWMVNITGAK
jgi:PhnB protein